MATPKEKWCWYHQQYHPVEAFARNEKKPDGLQSECRAAQAERRGKIGKTVLRIGAFVAVAMAFHWFFASVLGLFASISGAMPWNWFDDAGMDLGPGDEWEVVPVDPVPVEFPEDLAPTDEIAEWPIGLEMTEADTPEDYPYRMPDRTPDIAVGRGEGWT